MCIPLHSLEKYFPSKGVFGLIVFLKIYFYQARLSDLEKKLKSSDAKVMFSIFLC